jgi:hypothetical protein
VYFSFLRPKRVALALIGTVALVACGGSNPSTTPTVPTQPSTTPTTTPSTPPVVAQSLCERMGDGTYAAPCSKGAARFYDQVDGAIDKLIKKQPQLFDMSDVAGPGSYRVLEPDDYYLAMSSTLAESGLCAQMDADKANLRVKADNAMSEDYQILTTRGFTARGAWIYRNTCTPANFPIAAPDAISYIRLSFFGFNCAPGVPVPDRGTKELPLKCDGYLTATPKDANGRTSPPRSTATRSAGSSRRAKRW